MIANRIPTILSNDSSDLSFLCGLGELCGSVFFEPVTARPGSDIPPRNRLVLSAWRLTEDPLRSFLM